MRVKTQNSIRFQKQCSAAQNHYKIALQEQLHSSQELLFSLAHATDTMHLIVYVAKYAHMHTV
jgi:hypothetical protein